jgi:hypothetical protein
MVAEEEMNKLLGKCIIRIRYLTEDECMVAFGRLPKIIPAAADLDNGKVMFTDPETGDFYTLESGDVSQTRAQG